MDALAGFRPVSDSDDPLVQLVEKERECDRVSILGYGGVRERSCEQDGSMRVKRKGKGRSRC